MYPSDQRNDNYNYSLSLKYVKGNGILKYNNMSSTLGPNSGGKTTSLPVLDTKIDFLNGSDLVFNLKYSANMRYGFNEIYHGESLSESTIDKDFPFYYFLNRN